MEESNKFLVFKYSEGDAVLEITLKEMPFSLFATAYLIKVPARCDDEVSMMMKQQKAEIDYWTRCACVTPVIAVYE